MIVKRTSTITWFRPVFAAAIAALLLVSVVPAAGAATRVVVRSPKSGAVVSGTIRWQVAVPRRLKVTHVRYAVDGRRVFTDRRAPFRYGKRGRLNVGALGAGEHRLTIAAVTARHKTFRRTVVVTVAGGPAAAQTTPNGGSFGATHSKLNWNLAPGATTSQIYRGTQLIATRPAPVTSFTDSMLWFGTTYIYTVKMLDAQGNLVGTLGPITESTDPAPPGGFPSAFPLSSVWAAPIAPGHATSPSSASFVNYIVTHKGTPQMPTRQYGVPVYEADANDPLSGPFACAYVCNIANPIPIPSYAVPDQSSDPSMAIISPDGSTEWDFYKPVKNSSGQWTRTSAGVALSTSGSGVVPAGFGGADAANFALLGGLIRPEEIATGRINHAITIGVPGIASGRPACPATANAGVGGGIIPEGVRFQLDPTINVATLGLPSWQQTVARALQEYGAYVRDNAGVLTVYGETSTPTIGGRRYDGWKLAGAGVDSNQTAQTFSSNFPWSRMRALDFTYC